MTDNGMLFFIMPQKVKSLKGISSFEYDITLLTWNDSITLNYTCKTKKMETPQDFKIISGDSTYNSMDCNLLFVDIIKKGFEVRITTKFLYRDFEKIIQCDTPPIFSFTQGGEEKSATFSQKKWDKEREILNKIISVYNYSRK